MCLFTNEHKASVSDGTVKCLKLVHKFVRDGEVYYRSLYGFYGFIKYKVGEITNMIFENSCNKSISHTRCTITVSALNGGYAYRCDNGLHSFAPNCEGWKNVYHWARLNYNKEVFERINFVNDDYIGVALLECVIPEGSKYFTGVSNCIRGNADERGYCSEYLYVNREVDPSEYGYKKDWY